MSDDSDLVWHIPAVLILLLILSGCPQPPPAIESRPVPAAVIVDDEITGPLLGKPLRQPYGLARAAGHAVAVVDRGNNRLLLLDQELRPRAETAESVLGLGPLKDPTYVDADILGNLMVVDEGHNRLVQFDRQLMMQREIPFRDADDLSRLGNPVSVRRLPNTDYWVTDRDEDQIAVFDFVGNFDTVIGGFGHGGGQLSSPEQLFLDSEERPCVCDAGNGRIVCYDDFGRFRYEYKDIPAGYPIAAAVDQDRIWVVDGADEGRLLMLNKSGKTIAEFGPRLVGSNQPLRQPSDIIVLLDGRLLLSDTGNDRLLVLRLL